MQKRKLISAVLVAVMTLSCAVMFSSCGQDSFVGVYLADEQTGLADKGIYVFYIFDEDGSFSIESWVIGTTDIREGTWEMDGDDLTVSMPEHSQYGLVAPAVQNMPVTIEEDNLSFGGQMEGTTAKKISDSEYEDYVADSKSKGGQ